MSNIVELLEINSKFYKVFAAGDFFAMEYLWAKQHDVTVIHPGWPAIHGFEKVMKSWRSIFLAQEQTDIRCINEKASILSDSGFVTCTEVLGDLKLVATNVFVKEDDLWKMIHHHAAPIEDDEDEPEKVMH